MEKVGGKMLLLISNDKRMNYLGEYLQESGVEVVVYTPQTATFDLALLSQVNYMILPFGGMAEDGKIANTQLYLTDAVLQALPQDAIIFTPIRYPKLLSLLTQTPRQLEVIFDYDEIAIYNSVPTAEGVIYHMIKNTDTTIHQSSVLVVGSGRTGITIARDLDALGANVSVTYRRAKDEARLFEMGVEPLHIDLMVPALPHYDVIVNTVPVLLFDKQALDQVKQDAYIIDVSSKPGGVDFDYAKKIGINAELAGSLPSYIAPKTAAYYLYRFIKNYITNH